MDKLISKILKNGINVTTYSKTGLYTISACFSFNTPINMLDNQTLGVFHFIEHLICQSTELQKKLDLTGAYFGGETYKEYTRYFLRVQKDYFMPLFKIILKSLFDLKITNSVILKEKQIVLNELKSYQNNDYLVADDNLEKLLFPQTKIRYNSLGNRSSLGKLSITSINGYYKKFYQTNNLNVSVVGNLNNELNQNIFKNLNLYKNQQIVQQIKTNTFFNKTSKRIVNIKSKSKESIIAIGYHGYNKYEPEKYALRLLSNILTNGYNSLLFDAIREKRGLVYYLESFTVEYSDLGYFEIKTASCKKNADIVKDLLIKKLKNIIHEIDINKLNRSKIIFKNSTFAELENPLILAAHLIDLNELGELNKNINPETALFYHIDELNLKKFKDIIKKINFNKPYISIIS